MYLWSAVESHTFSMSLSLLSSCRLSRSSSFRSSAMTEWLYMSCPLLWKRFAIFCIFRSVSRFTTVFKRCETNSLK